MNPSIMLIRMFADSSHGKWMVPGLALVFAILSTFLSSANLGTASIIVVFGVAFILFLLVFVLLWSLLPRLYPASSAWAPVSWLAALGIAGVLIVIGFPLLVGLLSSLGLVAQPGSVGSFTTYEDPALGFRISYPGTWVPLSRKSPGSDIITNTAFISPDGKTAATVQVIDLTQPGYLGVSLDVWTEHSLDTLRSNEVSSQFRLLRSERTIFAGVPAQHLEYSVLLNSGDRIRTEGYLLQAGSRGYNLGFTSKDDSFGDWSGARQQVFDSFRVSS
jgi:hypothetical protein